MATPTLCLVEVLVLKRFPREKNSTFFYFVQRDRRIKIGDLLEVPWRKDKVGAIVVAKDPSPLRNYSPIEKGILIDFRKISLKKNSFYSSLPTRVVLVKSIGKMLAENFIRPELLLNLKNLAEKHFVSWNHLALATLKLPSKSKRSNFFVFDRIKQWINLMERSSGGGSLKKSPTLKTKNLNGKDYVFVNYNQERELLAIIGAVVEAGRQVLIITPEKQALYPLAAKYSVLSGSFSSSSAVPIDSSAPPFWFRNAWNLARNGDQKIFVGTRSAIFAPFENLGLVILENGSSENYKQWDLNPRFDIRKVVPILYPKAAKLYLSNAPRVEDFASEAKVIVNEEGIISIKKYRVAEKLPLLGKSGLGAEGPNYKTVWRFGYRGQNRKITLVDAGVENQLEDRKYFLGINFLRSIKRNISAGKLNIVIGEPGFLEKVSEELRETAGLDPENVVTIFRVGGAAELEKLGQFMKEAISQRRVLLAGRALLPFINIMRHSETAVFWPSFDRDLFATDFRSEEKALGRIFNCLSFAEEIFIRTETAENQIFQQLRRGQYLAFFPDWLRERKKFGYPPEFLLFKLIAVGLKPGDAKNKAEKLASNLENWATVRDAIASLEAEKIGKQGVYWSVIVRAKKEFPFEKLREILPSGFFFDPDPETLK